MPETFKQYQVWHLGLWCWHKPDNPTPSAEEGDIVVIRRAAIHTCLGLKELRIFVYIPVTCGGADDEVFMQLDTSIGVLDEGVPDGRYAKRRYSIPFEHLAKVFPRFHPASARDLTLVYQPFLQVDSENGFIVARVPPLDICGLVYDKQRTRFL